jgi:hypothetical protein
MTDLDDLLARSGRVEAAPYDVLSQARAVLHASINTAEGDRGVSWGGVHRRGGRKLALIGLVAAGVAAVITVPAVVIGSFHPGVDAQAAAVLRAAARSAAAQSGGWPDAKYWHVASSYVRDGHTYRRDIWIAHHGVSVLYDRGLGNGIDPRVISLGEDGRFDAAGVQLTWDQLYSLPTDPDKLASVLRSDGASSDTTMFNAVADLLRETPAPPSLRRALYEVAATIPSIQPGGQVTDSRGRTGTAIECGSERLVIDTATGQLLEDTQGDWVGTYITQGPAARAPQPESK